MSLLDTLRKNLSSELFTQVTDALGDDFNYDLVPRSRLNKVIGQRDDARNQLRQLTQAGDGDEGDDGDDDDFGDGGQKAPTKQKKAPKAGGGFSQADLEEAVRKAQEQSALEIKNLRLRYAATEKLREAKIVDPELVLNSKLVDLTKITVDDSGAITGGLDDQIQSIVQNRPYLVSGSGGAGGAGKGTGKDGGGDPGGVTSREDFLKLPLDQQLKFKETNPDVFKSFMQNL